MRKAIKYNMKESHGGLVSIQKL